MLGFSAFSCGIGACCDKTANYCVNTYREEDDDDDDVNAMVATRRGIPLDRKQLLLWQPETTTNPNVYHKNVQLKFSKSYIAT